MESNLADAAMTSNVNTKCMGGIFIIVTQPISTVVYAKTAYILPVIKSNSQYMQSFYFV